MAVLNAVTSETGLVGVMPGIVYINTNDESTDVVATGYLNASVASGTTYPKNSMALVVTTDKGPSWYKIVVSGANTSLVLVAQSA